MPSSSFEIDKAVQDAQGRHPTLSELYKDRVGGPKRVMEAAGKVLRCWKGLSRSFEIRQKALQDAQEPWVPSDTVSGGAAATVSGGAAESLVRADTVSKGVIGAIGPFGAARSQEVAGLEGQKTDGSCREGFEGV